MIHFTDVDQANVLSLIYDGKYKDARRYLKVLAAVEDERLAQEMRRQPGAVRWSLPPIGQKRPQRRWFIALDDDDVNRLQRAQAAIATIGTDSDTARLLNDLVPPSYEPEAEPVVAEGGWFAPEAPILGPTGEP